MRVKLQNAATALMTITAMQSQLPVPQAAIHQGLLEVNVPGRFQEIDCQCPVILDVAHNPQACSWLAEQLAMQLVAGKTVMIIGLAESNTIAPTLSPLLESIDTWVAVPLSGRPSHSITKIEQELRALGVKNCYTSNNLADALQAVLEHVTALDRIVVSGSFSAVQEAMQFLGDRTHGG